MFLNNKASHRVELHRTHFRDGVFAAAAVTTIAYRVTADGLARHDLQAPAPPEDWQSATKCALWHGVSVTVSGTVQNARRALDPAHIQLRVAAATRALQVAGDRHWARQGRTWVPSSPARWASIALSWSLAFGGTCEVLPGPVGPAGIPHPGGRCPYPWNPGGKGFCLREADAEGQPLPNIEWSGALVSSPMDRPRPAGLTPCAGLPGLRLPIDLQRGEGVPAEPDIKETLMDRHVAPRELIFEQVPAGGEIEVRGMSTAPICFPVPACPARVAVRRGRSCREVPSRVRSIHIDADERIAWITFGHMFSYETAPAWVDVAEA